MSDDVVHLASPADDGPLRSTVEIDLAAGARIRQITVADDADAVDLLASADEHDPFSTGWGSFPMAPWAGRLRNGRFRFFRRDVGLDLNHADGTGTGGGPISPPRAAPVGPISGDDLRCHAIHGTTFARRWDIVDAAADSIEVTCRLDGALGWDFPGIARQVIIVSPTRLDLTLSVEADDGAVFPASVGWHPWFAKPDRLVVHPIAMFEQDEFGLPTGRLIAPPQPPWDDCFINRAPVELHYGRRLAPLVTVSSPDCEHWVIYDKPQHATCVEPQSGPPDALNVRPELATSTHPLRRTMTIDW
jgi:aldose 1-epimerase